MNAAHKGRRAWNAGLYQCDAAMFWSAVERSEGCWLWRGTVGTHGYGQIRFGGRLWRAHRLAYTLTYGPIASRDVYVCHRCDVTRCVRPDHLFLGTNSDNQRDAVRKGRHRGAETLLRPHRIRRGVENPAAKLTEDDVRAIRTLRRDGARLTEIAARYPVHPMTIGEICRREIWKHVA
jgi:hypothetical protein